MKTDRELMQQALDAMRDAAYDEEGYTINADLAEAHDALEARLAHCDRCGKRLGGEGDIHTCTPDPIGDAQDRLIAEIAAQPEQEPVAWLYPEGLEALKAGKCWTAYGTKQDDNCNILVYLAAVAQKVEPVKTECDGFDSHPAAQRTGQEPVATLFGSLPVYDTTPPAAQRQ